MGETAAEQPPSERFAELIVKRTRKDDGRALILYSHAEPAADDPPAEREPAAPSDEQA